MRQLGGLSMAAVTSKGATVGVTEIVFGVPGLDCCPGVHCSSLSHPVSLDPVREGPRKERTATATLQQIEPMHARRPPTDHHTSRPSGLYASDDREVQGCRCTHRITSRSHHPVIHPSLKTTHRPRGLAGFGTRHTRCGNRSFR